MNAMLARMYECTWSPLFMLALALAALLLGPAERSTSTAMLANLLTTTQQPE